MADRLEIYKGALRLIGHSASISSLTEASPVRRALDDAWRSSVNYVLAKGLWNHAIRVSELQPDTDHDPRFGFQYAYSKPVDWIRLARISANETFTPSLEDYEDEAGFWHSNASSIHIAYVSDGDAYGWNIGAWRQPFAKAIEAYLAYECGLPISADRGNRNDMFSLSGKAIREAKTLDAVDERVQVKPTGRLVKARFSGRSDRAL